MNHRNKTEMTIGLVLTSPPEYSETFFRNKIKGLQSQGFIVILFISYKQDTDDYPCKTIKGIDFTEHSVIIAFHVILSLLKAIFLTPLRSLRLYKLDKKDGFTFIRRIKNIILNQFLLSKQLDWLHFGFGMLAVGRENVAKAINAKMAVSFRGYDLFLSPLTRPGCYQVLFQKDVHYHVLSQEMKRVLLDYGLSSDRINVITPAINTHFFRTQKEKFTNLSQPVQIVTVARLHWKKGLEYTLEALALLKQRGIQFKYTIIGDGNERERLIFASHQLNLSEQVHFAGKMSQDDIKAQLEKSDLYLQYSIQEGFCNAVLEAQAMGLLCLVSNAEGLDENILDGLTGWVIRKRQPVMLADKIMEVLTLSHELQLQIRHRAASRVQNEFGLEMQKKFFEDFYVKD